MPEARDGEQLGDALQEPQDDRLGVGDQRGEDHAAGVARPFRAGLEPREDEGGEPDEERSDAVLRVVMADPAWWPGKKPGSDCAGSAQ